MRPRLTYSNVVSTLCLILLIGGGAAYAASHLGKNSVGSKQLRKNAVTTAKIKNNAVTGAKIKDNSVDGSKIVDGSVTGADINAPSTSFSQIVARLRGTATVPFTPGELYPLANASYTQNAGEDNEVLANLEVNFPASCTAPRSVQAYVMEDAENPKVLTISNVAGVGLVEDKGSGSVTRTINFSPIAGNNPSRIGPANAIAHTFSILMTASNCTAGSGITATGAGIDVIGTK